MRRGDLELARTVVGLSIKISTVRVRAVTLDLKPAFEVEVNGGGLKPWKNWNRDETKALESGIAHARGYR